MALGWQQPDLAHLRCEIQMQADIDVVVYDATHQVKIPTPDSFDAVDSQGVPVQKVGGCGEAEEVAASG